MIAMFRFLIRYILRHDRVLGELRELRELREKCVFLDDRLQDKSERCEHLIHENIMLGDKIMMLETRLAHARAEIGHWEDRCGQLRAASEHWEEKARYMDGDRGPKFPVSMP